MVIIISLYVLMASAAIMLLRTKHKFDGSRDSIKQRILVVGSQDSETGGKVAHLLRAAGIRTFSRTTAPCQLTLPDGQEAKIERPKPTHFFDWSRLLRSFAARRADAVVYSHSTVNKGFRGRLELLFFRPTIVVVAGDSTKVPAKLQGVTVIDGSQPAPILKAVASHLGIKALVHHAQPPTSSSTPLLTYTTRTKVRQRLHAIIDKLDSANSAA